MTSIEIKSGSSYVKQTIEFYLIPLVDKWRNFSVGDDCIGI